MAVGEAGVDWIGLVERTAAAVSGESGATGDVDAAYVEKVRFSRDRDMLVIAQLAMNNKSSGMPIQTPGHNICTADHNATQLVWEHPGSLPEGTPQRRGCVYGDRCVASELSGIMGTNLPPLPEFLNPTQWGRFKADGALPTSPGRCLLCIRRDYDISLKIQEAGEAPGCIPAPMTNPVDMIGGYRSECTVSVYKNAVSGGPVVRHYSGAEGVLTLEVDRDGRWRINEDKLRWVHPKC